MSENTALDAIVEVRDYTIEAEWLSGYRDWAVNHGVPWLQNHLDVAGFWVDDGLEGEVTGSDPVVSPHGQPNVCWVIRWESMQARTEGWKRLRDDPTWADVWAKHPNPGAYLHTNIRFMKPLL